MRFLNSFAPPTLAARALSSPGEWEPRWDSAVCREDHFHTAARREAEQGELRLLWELIPAQILTSCISV